MAHSAKYASGASLLEALASEETTSEDTFVGLVKASDSEGSVAFTSGTCDDEWVDIPADLVGSVEVLGQVPCGGHSHPRVRMQLELDANDPLHGIVRKLMKGSSSARQNAASARQNVASARQNVAFARRPRFPWRRPVFPGFPGLRLGEDDDYWEECFSYCAGETMVCVCYASDGEVWAYPCGSC